MTPLDCKSLVASYVDWLHQRISVRDLDGICEITTPFLDRHNDHLQIYVRKTDEGLVLTDDGYTIKDLKLTGCEFSTDKRRQMLTAILNGFGIQLHGDELQVRANPHNFPHRKHNLLQAMLAVGDLFAMASPTVAGIFREDVERFLRLSDVRFTPSVKFTGRSGFDHYFDFVIPASRVRPERVLRAMNKPNKQNASVLIFSWEDTKAVRSGDSLAYAMLNDGDQAVNPDVLSALSQYDIRHILWSQREQHLGDLAA